MNASHRVTRRKSMTSTISNNTAVFKAAINGGGSNLSGCLGQKNRRSMPVKPSGSNRAMDPMSVDNGDQAEENNTALMNIGKSASSTQACGNEIGGSAVSDGAQPSEHGGPGCKSRIRRASEGAHMTKGESKRASGELRCEKCGKGYKHSSCLTKHLWEHTPEWAYTSKLLISKHQQVQLLEAASVLVGMNQETTEALELAKINDSDRSSVSPAASGTSEIQDVYLSSTETTPPPTSDNVYASDKFGTIRSKRHSGNSSSFSRSYQSSSWVPVGSAPSLGGGFGQYPPPVGQRRPSTSGAVAPYNISGDDEEAGLVAAVESLCSFGTPRSGAMHLPAGIPPVPPLPPKYAGQTQNSLAGTQVTSTAHASYNIPPPSTHRLSNERHALTKGRQSVNVVDSDDFAEQAATRGKEDDDDELMFGRDEAIY
ncbi:MAG: hypothetical protein Q9191_005074 [Dirinaria sp. TL-2023a]